MSAKYVRSPGSPAYEKGYELGIAKGRADALSSLDSMVQFIDDPAEPLTPVDKLRILRNTIENMRRILARQSVEAEAQKDTSNDR